MKRYVKGIVAIMSAWMLLSGCGNSVTQGKVDQTPIESEQNVSGKIEDEPMHNQKIVIGYNGGLCTGAPGIAYAKGYFEKHGLDVEIVNVQAANEAIGTGKIHVLTNHIAAMLVPAVNGVNMTFVAGAQTGCKSLYVLNDGKINSTHDLIGKTIAVPDGIGDSDHNIALRFLNHDNIDPKEVTFKPVDRSAVIQAMQNGEIQAAVLSDQFAEAFILDGTIKYIRSLTYDADFKQEPCCVHAFNKDFVDQNPLTAAEVAKAIVEARNWMEDNKEEATQILFDNDWASGDFDLALKMMKSYNFKVSNEDSEQTLKNILNDYKKFGIISSDKDTEELLKAVWTPLTLANEESNE